MLHKQHNFDYVTKALNDVVISADYPGQMAKVIKQNLVSEVLFSLGAVPEMLILMTLIPHL
jgi:hypothetical protein